MDQAEIMPIVAGAAGAAAFSYALAWAARLMAPHLGYCDKPDNVRKLHGRAIPLLGGTAVVGGMLGGFVVARLLSPEPAFDAGKASWLIPLLISTVGMTAIGLWDDRAPLRPRIKLLWQIGVCLPFVAWGTSLDALTIFNWHLPLAGWGALFALGWLVACVNATNLLDGSDGAASSFGIMAAIGLTILSGSFEAGSLALALAGGLFGFLLHNWPPARIFMGDTGSLTLGLLLGGLALVNCTSHGEFYLAPALALLSVPFWDTAAAIGRRLLRGTGIAVPDRQHLHHCLQDCGLSRWETACFIGCTSASTVAAGVAAAISGVDAFALVICAALAMQLVVSRLFGRREVGLLLEKTRGSLVAPAPAPHVERPPMLLPLTSAASRALPANSLAPVMESSEEKHRAAA